jgi:hypothetical protein
MSLVKIFLKFNVKLSRLTTATHVSVNEEIIRDKGGICISQERSCKNIQE